MEDMESIRSQSGKGAAVSCLCPDNRTEADCAGPDGLNRFNTVGSKLSTYRKEVAGESGDLEVIEKHSSKSCLTHNQHTTVVYKMPSESLCSLWLGRYHTLKRD